MFLLRPLANCYLRTANGNAVFSSNDKRSIWVPVWECAVLSYQSLEGMQVTLRNPHIQKGHLCCLRDGVQTSVMTSAILGKFRGNGHNTFTVTWKGLFVELESGYVGCAPSCSFIPPTLEYRAVAGPSASFRCSYCCRQPTALISWTLPYSDQVVLTGRLNSQIQVCLCAY